MSEFVYRSGLLHAEQVALPRIADAVGTPCYVYSASALERAYRAYAAGLAGLPATICYALKANSNQAVIKTFARLGAGADVVSLGELKRALAAGVPPSKIVFSGVGKTAEEMAAALDAAILQFNVESEPELDLLAEVAAARGKRAAFALRVNPDVDAGTHAKITTGKADNKFGLPYARIPALYRAAAARPSLDPVGLAQHIGSQLTDLVPFRTAFQRLAALVRELKAAGLPVKRLDLGGGLGIVYSHETPPSAAAYGDLVRTELAGLGTSFLLEPGRALVGEAGLLLTRVIRIKRGARNFVIVDAAMNDLLRPMLYDAWHRVRPVVEPAAGTETTPADLVGPICETGDTFAVDRPLPPVAAGDLLVIDAAGAYGAVMASTYNSRPLIAEVMVRAGEFAVIRPRQAVEEQIGRDCLPHWLSATEPQRGVA